MSNVINIQQERTKFISHETPSCHSFQNIGMQLMQTATDQVALISRRVTSFVM